MNKIETELFDELGWAGRFIPDYRKIDLRTFLENLNASIVAEVNFPDVDFYLGAVNWDTLRTLSDCVIVRMGQNLWIDSEFIRNWTGAKRVGMKRGAYWFYDDRVSPESQAQIVIGLLEGDLPEMEFFADWEKTYSGAYNKLSDVVRFMKLVSAAFPTLKVGMYTGYYWFTEHSNAIANANEYAYLKDTALWEAWYTTNVSYVKIPAPWTKITHWQYTEAYNYTGYTLDMNYFNGTEAEFNNKYGITPPSSTDIHIHTHDGIDYYQLNRFGTRCFVHVIDPLKVRVFVTPGPFQTVGKAIEEYGADGGTNGGGWPNVQDATHRSNEIWYSDGTPLQITAKDDRPYINFRKDGTIRISKNDILGNDMWNTVGYDRLLGSNGVFNSAITELSTKDARTCSGTRPDGKWVILVAEGDDMLNVGFTFPECWAVLHDEFGVTDAGNHDGGSSSSVFNKAVQEGILNHPSGGVESNVLNHILFFAVGGTPPNGGDMTYRYSAVSASYNMTLRQGHDAYSLPVTATPTLAAGKNAFGDELFVATSDIKTYVNGVLTLTNLKGDTWLHVKEMSVNGVPTVVDGWVAIIHMGKQYMTLTDNGATPPPPPSPEVVLKSWAVVVTVDGVEHMFSGNC